MRQTSQGQSEIDFAGGALRQTSRSRPLRSIKAAEIDLAMTMPLYWLCYRDNNTVCIVIEPASSLIAARLRAAIDGVDKGEFSEGHELDRKWKIAKEMVGRRLTQAETKTGPASSEWEAWVRGVREAFPLAAITPRGPMAERSVAQHRLSNQRRLA